MSVYSPPLRSVIEPFPTYNSHVGVPLPDACIVGMREELTPVGETEKATTWNGRTRILTAPWKRKWNIKLSNSGIGVHLPPIDDLHVGMSLRFHSSQQFQKLVPVGQAYVQLDRIPSWGEFSVRDSEDRPIAVLGTNGPEGQIAILATTADARTRVYYRPAFDVVLVDITGLGSGYSDRESSWSMELEEEYAPV